MKKGEKGGKEKSIRKKGKEKRGGEKRQRAQFAIR